MASESFDAPPLQRQISKRKFEVVNGSPNASQNAPQNARNDPSQHTIASYNMSFASDLGVTAFGSEKHFVYDANERIKNGKRQGKIRPDPENQDPNKHPLRHAWTRAAQLVRHFWEAKNPSAMGLQEMNTKAKVGQASPAEGYEQLQRILQDMGHLRFYANSVESKGTFPTLLTIWNVNKLGEIMTHGEGNNKVPYDYVADLGLDDPFAENSPLHKGRPITIIYTKGGFVLINLHGPNWSEQSYQEDMKMKHLRASINMHLKNFLERYRVPLDTNKLFIMGDFNDPFHAIKFSNPLIISQDGIQNTPLFYNSSDEDKIKSCCYNFNSACPSGILNETGEKHVETRTDEQGYKLSADPYECFIRMNDNKDIDQTLSGKVKKDAVVDGEDAGLELSMGSRGLLTNYQFTGDYVMGANVVTNLQTYRPRGTVFFTKYSLESDHEMVFATFSTNKKPILGGRRARRTRHKKTARRTRHKKEARRTRHKALRNRRTRRN
jgi:hypothetical protein